MNQIPNQTSFFKSIKHYFRLYRKSFLLIGFLTTLGSLITVINPKLINLLLEGTQSGDFAINNIIIYGSIIFGLIILLGITIYLRRTFANSLAREIEVNYRNRILHHLLNLDLNFYEKHSSGEIITKVINDTNVMADNSKEIPIIFLSSIITFIGSIIVMFFIEWKLTLVVVSLTILILFFAIFTFRILHKWYAKTRKAYTILNGKVIDRLSVIKLIKANATEKYEIKNFNNLNGDYLKLGRKTDQREGIIFGIFFTLISSINIIAIMTGIIFIKFNIIKIEEITTTLLPFILSVNILIFPIMQTLNVLGRLATVTVSIKRLNQLLTEKSLIGLNLQGIKINNINDNIIFKNISFSYENNLPVLENFNFTFKQNNTYAIVGATGVGKTTISKLLLRFYDPQKGSILINNHDLKELNLESYLHKVGYIEQEPEIFNGTFIENIKYGSFDATDQEVIAAAKKANLDKFINELPKKYQTIVGEKGFILSGGQKQRILIARIILKNPQLLILDEATSALDNIVEREIQIQLSKLMKNRTVIIIAHRLSTIKNVDQILVLEKNEGVTQVGSFSELIKVSGHFKKLYEAGLINN